jgi:hypothetical protein
MNTAGYWIGRHPDPDGVILDRAGIESLNARIREQGLVRDLANLPPKTGEELRKDMEDTIAWIGNAKIFQKNGKRVNKAFMRPLVEQMDCGTIPAEVTPRYGFLSRQADIRVLPTNDPLYDGPGDSFIDNVQASALERGTPLVIFHQSRDGEWLYAVTDIVSGWIPARVVAIADVATFIKRYREPAKLLVTSARADLYADEKLTAFIGYARMGTALARPESASSPSNGGSPVLPGAGGATLADGVVKIALADRDASGNYRETPAWVSADQVSAESLVYSPRTMYRQAFRLLNTPYGWGGTFGEQDCSQFLCEIFSTVGITLPRNSGKQMRVGALLDGFTADTVDGEKCESLAVAALPGATILRLPGHIMLYLGMVDGKPYVIHSTWAYREMRGRKEIVRLINRVTVSNLELGAGSKKGTHLHRMTTASVITLPPDGTPSPVANP